VTDAGRARASRRKTPDCAAPPARTRQLAQELYELGSCDSRSSTSTLSASRRTAWLLARWAAAARGTGTFRGPDGDVLRLQVRQAPRLLTSRAISCASESFPNAVAPISEARTQSARRPTSAGAESATSGRRRRCRLPSRRRWNLGLVEAVVPRWPGSGPRDRRVICALDELAIRQLASWPG